MDKIRCDWSSGNELMIKYHDTEWGVPLHDDDRFFEFLVLESFQAGLSWQTILNKRENFREAFDGFDYRIIANYDERKIEELLNNKGIIRNKLKINATIGNAKAFMLLQKTFGSFDKYIWQFTNERVIVNQWQDMTNIPANSKESDAMSKDLKGRGFKFVGTTICYAFMQATGMVNDHLIDCYRHNEVNQL